MSTSALPVSGDCVVAPNCFDLSTDLCSTLQQDSCPSMHETCTSFCEEEADFLTELLVKQEAASQPIHLFPDDGAESSGTQAAMSDVSTTFGDWEADGVVPNLTCASSMISSLQVPVKPTSLMLQLDYSDVISAWEEMATDQKHPISQPLHQHTHSDQLTTLHAPCAYTMPQSPLSTLDALPNFPPSFSAPPRMSGRLASRSAPISHMSGQCHSMMSAMSAPTLGTHAPCLPVQQACAAHTVAEKTASLERYRAKKTTRQSGSSKIRYQIRKTNADNRLRFKGCFVKPSKLAELQMEAALNSECQDASSPMISGGSSESIFS
ncbi:TPA: hypothetical protein ACH3X3_003761 [Trebouxia sp. C0006]